MMLESMRKGVAKVVGSILAVLLIVAMAAWGIEDFLRAGPENQTLASVGDGNITTQVFENEYRTALDQLRARLGGNLDPDRARQFGLPLSTLNGMIEQRLIALQADRLRLRVGETTLQDEIARNPAFRNVAGQFDQALFQQGLQNLRLSEGQFVLRLRRELANSFLINAVAAGSVAPTPLVSELYRFIAQERSANYVLVPRSPASKVGTPTEAQLSEFHKKQAARFTAPEYRKISAIILDPADYAKDLKPDDDAIQAEFENRLPSLKVPERRKLQQILFTDEDKATKAAGLLKEGRAFADVAKEIAGKEKDTLSLGLMTKDEVSGLASDLADAAFSLKKNEVTAPVRSALGWHILRVEEIQPGKTPTLEEVRDTIATDLARDQAIDQLVEVANKVEDALAGGSTLDEAAQNVGARVRLFPQLDAQGAAEGGKTAPKFPEKEKFLRTAFATGDGEVSSMEETENGGFFILRVDAVAPPALRPLAKIRKDVIAAWRRARQDTATAEHAKKLVEKINGGTDFADAAKGAGLKPSTSGLLSRRGDPTGKFPNALVQELFRLKRGGAAAAATPDGQAVIQLKDIKDRDKADDKEENERFVNGISDAIGRDLNEQFSLALRQSFAVSIDQKALDAYLDRYSTR